MSLVQQAIKTTSFNWAVGGWSFFIAENLFLSENRAFIIDAIGDDNYHYLYGLISTAACGSIGYAYLYKVRNAAPLSWSIGGTVPPAMRGASFIFLAVGLGIISQVPPKLQISIIYASEGSATAQKLLAEKATEIQTTGPAAVPSPATPDGEPTLRVWKVRCPFDFTDSKSKISTDKMEYDQTNVQGLDRISRHPGLWSMGLIGLGQACLSPSIPQRAWLSMPILVAVIGGWHTDSRHRRGIGGTLSERLDKQTSNIPFAAILTGKQDDGDVLQSFAKLFQESKGLNVALGVGAAALIVLRKGRGGVSGASGLKLHATR